MAYEEGYYGKLASFNLDRIFRASKMTGQEFAEATGELWHNTPSALKTR